MKHFRLALSMIVFLGLGCSASSGQSGEEELTIFAAASLGDVVEELAERFEQEGGAATTLNVAGSNILAQQIRAAPGADLFFSADEDWVRFLEAQGRLAPASARPFLGNRLVVIARRDASKPWSDLEPLRGDAFAHLVLADPGAVPAGRYAAETLDRLAPGLLETLDVVPALDVRAALQLVATDPKHVGIVYRTDALASDAVDILYELPRLEEVPIVYWAARLEDGGGPRAAERFLAFLDTEPAAAIFEKHGFVPP